MNRLVIPYQLFDALAGGQGGSQAGRFLSAAARDRHLILIKVVADTAASAEVSRSFDELARMHVTAPEDVDALLRYPAVGGWALATVGALRQGGGAREASQLAVLAATAGIRAGLPFEARLSHQCESVMFPSLGAAVIGSEDCLIRVTSSNSTVSSPRSRVGLPVDYARDADGWLGLRRIVAEHPHGVLRLALDDLDPYRFPAGPQLATRLTGAEVLEWQRLFQEAWTILCDSHASTADEIMSMLSAVTPLSRGGWAASGTSRTVFGCVALARPTCARTLASALAHEVQHAKLTVLLYLVDLIKPDPEARYYAPWRRDPRPLSGLLHGTYAHLGVADFWRRQRQIDDSPMAHAEFARWREAAAKTARVIYESTALTPIGRRFVDGMLRRLHTFAEEEVPLSAVELARAAAARHQRDFDAASTRRPREGERA
ncbi:HEXXH motif domain-containing protein [Nonomuraea gerenzanensis]|uniref:HEXXH motif domain-containing protein n=1 Tax=Nonomuraea gerenzanensis TaxID=93944 RepID=UPI001CD9EA00|nr:HEXXH motif domain-containing protein [Nonomuraea gerenzanensis]UBU14966.1 HEXXH motif domain-containing protein [Nonomuraea gerenzanensis]